MQRVLAIVALGLVVLGPEATQAAPKALPAEKNNYCLDEAMQWVKQRFGNEARILDTRIDKSGIPEKGVAGWRVLVWTDRCDGYFTMDYGVRAVSECTEAQVDEREPMLMMVGAMGGCRRLLARPDYPSGRMTGLGGTSSDAQSASPRE